MNKKIYKFIFFTSLTVIASASYAANTIHINGQIVEDTCSSQHHHQDCEPINKLNKKIEAKSISLEDLRNQSQKNSMIEVNIEKLPERNNSVIVVNYY